MLLNDNGHSGHQALPVRSVAGGIDGIGAVFDDGSLVAELRWAQRARRCDDTVRPRVGGRGRGGECHAGGRCLSGAIDDGGGWGRAQSAGVLPFAPLAPRRWGRRSFTFGCASSTRPREMGLRAVRRPSVAKRTVDLDSTVCEVCGGLLDGARYQGVGLSPAGGGLSGVLTRDVDRLIAATCTSLVRPWRGWRAPDAAVTVRADAGFFSTIAAIGAHGDPTRLGAATDIDRRQAIAYTRTARQVAGSSPARGDLAADGEAAKPAHAARRQGTTGAASSPTETTSTPLPPTPTTA